MAVSMQLVKELRDRTQAGLNDCRSAMVEAEGDIEKAVEIILKKGLAKSAKRAGAVATEGEVAALVSPDGKSAVLVEVNIQTDFAARNADFKAFVRTVVEAAAGAADGVDLGSLTSGGSTLEEQRTGLVARLGENVTVRRWGRVCASGLGRVHAYVHMGGKVGVLIAADVGAAGMLGSPGLTTFLDETAMQIAAMAPRWLHASEVPTSERESQAAIFDAQLAEEGKPEAVRGKIVEGKVAKWLKEVCLLESQSVLDTEKTVDQVRAAAAQALGTSLTVTGFLRYERGEGVEKAAGPSFADEVAKMAGG